MFVMIVQRVTTDRHRSIISCILQWVKSCHMLFDSSKKGKKFSDKVIEQKLIWHRNNQCSSIIEDDISPSVLMSCKEIVFSGERTLTGEAIWIIDRNLRFRTARFIFKICREIGLVFTVLLYFMLWQIEAFLLLLLLATIQKISAVEIWARQVGNHWGEKGEVKKGERKKEEKPNQHGEIQLTLSQPPKLQQSIICAA